ncbi:SigE family RNA polymerase sigma factor [Actinoplanes regularis]|uniref:RNA polymerase sigma-70 factor, sigma-E family n=1 Tax=Actinoplanes regularis TaxID=52697 RepID=A0A238XKP3_9ACTN|nr:SigE family RNA polymerase sigma factor [Actinoplanes regularis]GIE90520.1 RNA polymerase sigma24 factor [Actinoplanes regularis]SNR59043.1 RNA polymerase sigma-70 factor, sigma-E family [Actinoplanes regularis]
MRTDDDEVTAFVRASHSRLLRVAFLLCGDVDHAEDLVQTALAKTIVAWPRLDRAEGVDAYVQRILVNVYLSARRRRSWWERPFAHMVEEPARDAYAAVEQRDWLRRALDRLPARQRAAVVLRFHQDLSEQATADVLGCSVGTVKSLSSRGLRTLRQQADDKEAASRRDGITEEGVRYA